MGQTKKESVSHKRGDIVKKAMRDISACYSTLFQVKFGNIDIADMIADFPINFLF